jgi:hypothetical protein
LGDLAYPTFDLYDGTFVGTSSPKERVETTGKIHLAGLEPLIQSDKETIRSEPCGISPVDFVRYKESTR